VYISAAAHYRNQISSSSSIESASVHFKINSRSSIESIAHKLNHSKMASNQFFTFLAVIIVIFALLSKFGADAAPVSFDDLFPRLSKSLQELATAIFRFFQRRLGLEQN
jgi:hypothetical protein